MSVLTRPSKRYRSPRRRRQDDSPDDDAPVGQMRDLQSPYAHFDVLVELLGT
jgi:hypothetical protein